MKLASQIIYMKIRVTMSKKCIRIKKINETRYFVIHFSVSLRWHSFKARGLVYINLPWYSTLSLYGDGRVYLLVNYAESADR